MGYLASISSQYSIWCVGETLVQGAPIGPYLLHNLHQDFLASAHMLPTVKPSSIFPSFSLKNQNATFLPLAAHAGPLPPDFFRNSSRLFHSFLCWCLYQYLMLGCSLGSSWIVSVAVTGGVGALDMSVWYAFLQKCDLR